MPASLIVKGFTAVPKVAGTIGRVLKTTARVATHDIKAAKGLYKGSKLAKGGKITSGEKDAAAVVERVTAKTDAPHVAQGVDLNKADGAIAKVKVDNPTITSRIDAWKARVKGKQSGKVAGATDDAAKTADDAAKVADDAKITAKDRILAYGTLVGTAAYTSAALPASMNSVAEHLAKGDTDVVEMGVDAFVSGNKAVIGDVVHSAVKGGYDGVTGRNADEDLNKMYGVMDSADKKKDELVDAAQEKKDGLTGGSGGGLFDSLSGGLQGLLDVVGKNPNMMLLVGGGLAAILGGNGMVGKIGGICAGIGLVDTLVHATSGKHITDCLAGLAGMDTGEEASKSDVSKSVSKETGQDENAKSAKTETVGDNRISEQYQQQQALETQQSQSGEMVYA